MTVTIKQYSYLFSSCPKGKGKLRSTDISMLRSLTLSLNENANINTTLGKGIALFKIGLDPVFQIYEMKLITYKDKLGNGKISFR